MTRACAAYCWTALVGFQQAHAWGDGVWRANFDPNKRMRGRKVHGAVVTRWRCWVEGSQALCVAIMNREEVEHCFKDSYAASSSSTTRNYTALVQFKQGNGCSLSPAHPSLNHQPGPCTFAPPQPPYTHTVSIHTIHTHTHTHTHTGSACLCGGVGCRV